MHVDSNVSQGSVELYLRCCGIFSDLLNNESHRKRVCNLLRNGMMYGGEIFHVVPCLTCVTHPGSDVNRASDPGFIGKKKYFKKMHFMSSLQHTAESSGSPVVACTVSVSTLL